MINFRNATENDALDYATILNRSWKDTYGDYISLKHIDEEFNIDKLIKNFPDYIKDKSFELYMIEYNNIVVGVLELGMPEDIYKENMHDLGEIRTLHIKKEYQGLGIGKNANAFALKRLKELGYKHVCIWVKKQNIKSIKFHEKLGFIKTVYDCENTVDGAPSFVMEKELGECEEMKSLQETWQDLEKYLKVDRALELGFSNGNYTKELAKYAKNVTGIDISEEFMNIAKENLKDYNNIDLLIMDANHMDFSDKSFDLVLSTSFHEFDLSNEEYSVDLELKRSILTEMIRVSNTIIFIEPTEHAITNELFKVFNPNENHADRIEKSNKLINEFMRENSYELVDSGLTYNKDQFNSLDELNEEMLNWWADIKIPTSEEEKQQMISQIDQILKKGNMLDELYVTEEIGYKVFKKEN